MNDVSGVSFRARQFQDRKYITQEMTHDVWVSEGEVKYECSLNH